MSDSKKRNKNCDMYLLGSYREKMYVVLSNLFGFCFGASATGAASASAFPASSFAASVFCAAASFAEDATSVHPDGVKLEIIEYINQMQSSISSIEQI